MSSIREDVKADTVHAEYPIAATSIDPVAERKLVRKIDLYLMPSVFVLYLFSYVVSRDPVHCVLSPKSPQDRSNIGLAKIAGMETELNLSSSQYYIAVIVWVIGYTTGAVPSKYEATALLS
jgi:hypothetical protein